MAKPEVEIRDALGDRLGLSEVKVAEQVLETHLPDGSHLPLEVVPAEITDPEEVAAIRRAAVGMGKDRMDLPELAEMRRESDDRLERLFGDA